MQSGSATGMLVIAAGLFATFFLNVMIGANGNAAFLSDKGELLILFASCAVFVAATLQLEKKRQAQNGDPEKNNTHDN